MAAKLAKLLEKTHEGIKEENFLDQSVTYQHGLVGAEEAIAEDDDRLKMR